MVSLKGEKVYLRALEPDDLDFLYALENDESIWEVSHTLVPYSRHMLKSYIEQAHRDIYEVKQLRLCIVSIEHELLGMIDLFDFEPKSRRAGVGIIVKDPAKRGKGYASEALKLLCNYSFDILNLHQLYAHIGEGNKASVALFKSQGFSLTAVKKEWNLIAGRFRDELLFQKIRG